MSLTILLGDYGSGKTELAKHLANRSSGIYLDVEMLSRGNVTVVDKLKTIMKPDVDYYLDGGNSYCSFADLPKLLGTSVRYIVCMADPLRIYKAQEKKAYMVSVKLPRSEYEIKTTTQMAASIALTYDKNPLFADTTTKPVTFWGKDAWISRWMEINLYRQLKDKHEYQDVELSDRTVVGLSKSHKTWERLNVLVNFKGKSVIDYGCNLGYFCFKAEEAGACNITGVDVSPSVIATARSIAMTKNSRVHFVIAELKKYQPPYCDIALALNTFHHLDYDGKVLNTIFSRANEVILEMPAKDRGKVGAVANQYGFTPTVAGSHREGRCIIVYSRDKKITVPHKYEYHPRREAFKWWAMRMVVQWFSSRSLLRYLWRKVR